MTTLRTGSGISSAIDHDATEALLRRAQAGDREAFDGIVMRYWDRVHAIAEVRVGTVLARRVSPEDIVSMTLAAAWSSRDRFDARHAPRFILWLAKIAEHCIHDEAKKWSSQKRDLAREVEIASLRATGATTSGAIEDAAGSPSALASARELAQIYRDCLSELPEHYREIILLKDCADLSFADIASRNNTSEKAAGQLYSRAISKLALMLSRRGFELDSNRRG